MARSQDELRKFLGLSESDTLQVEATIAPAPDDAARGYAATALSPTIPDALEPALLVAVADEPSSDPDDDVRSRVPGLSARRWQGNAGIVLFSLSPATATFEGRSAYREGLGVVGDTRGSGFLLRVNIGGEERLLDASDGAIRVHKVTRASSEWEAARDLAPRRIPEIVLVPLDTVLEGVTVPDWLAQALEMQDGSDWYLRRVASRGLAARLAATFAENATALARAILAGTKTPTERVKTWASDLSADVVETLARDLADQAGRVLEDFESVEADVARGDADFVVADVCNRRDLLQSVHVVLALAGNKDGTDILTAVDRTAATLLSTLDLTNVAYGAVLEHVATEIPGAWWAPQLH